MSNNIKKRLGAIRGLNPMPEAERHKFGIADLKIGGYFSFRGQNWKVVSISRYLDVKWENFGRRKKEDWTTELTFLSLSTGELGFIEYSKDDFFEIFFTEKEVKLRELGIGRSELEAIADEEEGYVFLGGMRFHYSEDETWAALYFREGESVGIPVRFYEFEGDDGTCLTVELWHDDMTGDAHPEREAFISGEIDPSELAILQLS